MKPVNPQVEIAVAGFAGTPRDRPRIVRAARKYFNILRVSLIERMTYRGDFLLGTVLRFLPMVTTILLWEAVYTGSGQRKLSGYTADDMIAYLLLVHISRMFSSMPGLGTGIARDIREGTLRKYLLQPIDMIAYLLSYRVAHKMAYIATSCLPYAVLFFLCRDYFPGWPDWTTLLAYVAALLLGFLVGFFFEATIGMIGFWFLEVTSVLYVVNTLAFFVSGHMFPLDLLDSFSPVVVMVLKAMPFQYLAYFPAAVFLNHVPPEELGYRLLAEVGWILVFALLARGMYRLGLRRYSAYGG
jgi:ABC-2 type transport system permease protein